MIKVVIIDDEKLIRLSLGTLIEEEHPMLQIMGYANSVKTGVELIQKTRPDLVFLDIQMIGGTGFDLLDQLGNVDFRVIFFTAHDEFAVKAFKYFALDYLLKPIHPDELKLSIEKAIRHENQKEKHIHIQYLLENLQQDKFTKLALSFNSEIVFVDIESIIRIESDSNYCNFHLEDGRKILVSKSLKEYQEILEDNKFIRIHRSHLVNSQYIKKYNKLGHGTIILSNGDELSISRRRKEELLLQIENLF